MVDHKLADSKLDSLSLIDDFTLIEHNAKEIVEDELLYNLKIVKVHNILQVKRLKDKMRKEHMLKQTQMYKDEKK
jgi:hypothetical protein